MNNTSTNMTLCTLGGILSTLSNREITRLAALGEQITCLELRADLPEFSIDYTALRKQSKASLLFVLRSKIEGGFFCGNLEDRKQMLIKATQCCDLVELEGERDLIPEILEVIPPEKRVISWHGKVGTSGELLQRFKYFAQTSAKLYRLIPEARNHAETLIPLEFLFRLGRKDVISYAGGAIGQWTQIMAPYVGSPIVFGNIFRTEKITSVFTCEQLIENYGFPELHPFKTIYGITGNPVDRSKSPGMHNGAYQHLNMPAIYLPFHIVSFKEFWTFVVSNKLFQELGFEWGGFTVVSPFKEAVISFGEKMEAAIINQSLAGNVLKKDKGKWVADTTDFYGLKIALEKLKIDVLNFSVAIVGCGGAGRTMAAGLKANGANVLLINRSEGRAKKAAVLLDLPYMLLADFDPGNFDLVINATPLGKNDNELPFDPELLKPDATVIDITYAKGMTPLVRKSLHFGKTVVSGREILMYQVKQQFKLLTGRNMPEYLAIEMAGVDEEGQSVNNNIFSRNKNYEVNNDKICNRKRTSSGV